MSLFHDRRDAGRQLALKLVENDLGSDALVLGLARGGMPVAYEVARYLDRPLDVFVVRKLGVPFQPELAFGAIATGDIRNLNDVIVQSAGLTDEMIERVTREERRELHRREMRYRDGREPPRIQGQTILLVDDGIATGASMSAAIEALRHQNPARIIGAVPVAPKRSYNLLSRKVDRMVCLATPDPFMGVGAWYDDFDQTTDDDVRALLADQGQTPAHNRY